MDKDIVMKEYSAHVKESSDLLNEIGRPMSQDNFNKYVKHLGDLLELKEGDSLLDAPSGNGIISYQMKTVYKLSEITCIDLNKDMIDKAIALGIDNAHVASVVDLNMNGNEFKNNCFDKVMIGGVAMYLSTDDLLHAIRQAIRVCKRGGTVLIHDIPALSGKVTIKHLLKLSKPGRPDIFNILKWNFHDLKVINSFLYNSGVKLSVNFVKQSKRSVGSFLKNYEFNIDLVIKKLGD